MTKRLPRELALVAACCSWPRSPETIEQIRAAAGPAIDWHRFHRLVSFHRVRPLVHQALRTAQVELPERFSQELSSEATRARVQSLILARESLRLQQDFAANGPPALIVKGIPLAMLAYRELGMKESIDIDLLVAPETAAESSRLLSQSGYRSQLDEFRPREFESYAQLTNEAAFYNADTGIKVDLHWKLVQHRTLLRDVGVGSPVQDVAIPGATLRTLADKPLFAYMCVHGTLHNWTRLKWLADAGAFLATRTELEVVQLYEAAQAYHAGRCASVTLLLCKQLLGLSLDEGLSRNLEKDRVVRALVRNAVAGMAYRGGALEASAYTWPWLRLISAQFFIVRGAGHWVEQAGLLWNSPIDRARIALPRRFAFIYHLIRVPLWLGRIGKRLFVRPVADRDRNSPGTATRLPL